MSLFPHLWNSGNKNGSQGAHAGFIRSSDHDRARRGPSLGLECLGYSLNETKQRRKSLVFEGLEVETVQGVLEVGVARRGAGEGGEWPLRGLGLWL